MSFLQRCTVTLAMLATAVKAFNLPRGEVPTCGTGPPPSNFPRLVDGLGSGPLYHWIDIFVYAHVVTCPEKRDRYNQNQVNGLVNVLNDRLQHYGFNFVLINTSWTVDQAMASKNSFDATSNVTSLRQGDYRSLNLYYLSDLPATNGQIGYATYPVTPTPANYTYDGAFLHADTLPYGAYPDYNFGIATIHQIGHWLGLAHTFEGGCDGHGDGVADTPWQDQGTGGCTANYDSCPDQPGLDAKFNYMNFAIDTCLKNFTDGQNWRMVSVFNQTRGLRT
ncbi:Extracellular metalloprotease-like protein 2 [Elsinoe fawcettii]|nr:Extracellular metalloprotease-like protein 2 [Elsinoe fawcettii]